MIYKVLEDGEFYRWLQNSDSYKNNFTEEGANALQDYIDVMTTELEEDQEFDPIAWCCEYSEYASIEEAYLGCTDDIVVRSKKKMLEYLEGRTTVIKIDNSNGIILADF